VIFGVDYLLVSEFHRMISCFSKLIFGNRFLVGTFGSGVGDLVSKVVEPVPENIRFEMVTEMEIKS